MKKLIRKLRVGPDETLDLGERPTRINPVYGSKSEYKGLLAEHTERLSALQELLYASNRHALLVIFQAMDAAGKDGAIRHVMTGVNPQGCRVTSFSHPCAIELRHDFLWRTTRELPERGMIGIFNRSYYEEVLIVRVHPRLLAAEALPDDGDDKRIWRERFDSIVGFERHMHRNGTRVVKIFLHLSREEQKQRLLARIDTPSKRWKITPADIAERKLWKTYRRAYEECLSATSTKHAPWYVVPADDKLTARLLVSRIILDTLEGLDLTPPPLAAEREDELAEMRKALEAD